MRILFSACCLISGCLYAGAAHSSHLFLSDSQSFEKSQIHIADTLSTSPSLETTFDFNNVSPSSSTQAENNRLGAPVKFAAVNFLGDSGALPTPQPETSTCSSATYPYRYEMSLANCKTTSSCGKGTNIRFKCTSCKNNMTVGSDGRCKCNRTTYPYSMYDTPCPYGYDEPQSNTTQEQAKMCQEMGTDGVLRTSYKACTCPETWKECNNAGEVGYGTACVAKGKSYYSGCTCKAPYRYTCTGSGQNYDEAPSGNYCTNTITGIRYYKTCAQVCWTGYYKSVQDYWDTCGKKQCQNEELYAVELPASNIKPLSQCQVGNYIVSKNGGVGCIDIDMVPSSVTSVGLYLGTINGKRMAMSKVFKNIAFDSGETREYTDAPNLDYSAAVNYADLNHTYSNILRDDYGISAFSSASNLNIAAKEVYLPTPKEFDDYIKPQMTDWTRYSWRAGYLGYTPYTPGSNDATYYLFYTSIPYQNGAVWAERARVANNIQSIEWSLEYINKSKSAAYTYNWSPAPGVAVPLFYVPAVIYLFELKD